MKGAKGPMRGDRGRMRAGPGDAQKEGLLVIINGHSDKIMGGNERYISQASLPPATLHTLEDSLALHFAVLKAKYGHDVQAAISSLSLPQHLLLSSGSPGCLHIGTPHSCDIHFRR